MDAGKGKSHDLRLSQALLARWLRRVLPQQPQLVSCQHRIFGIRLVSQHTVWAGISTAYDPCSRNTTQHLRLLCCRIRRLPTRACWLMGGWQRSIGATSTVCRVRGRRALTPGLAPRLTIQLFGGRQVSSCTKRAPPQVESLLMAIVLLTQRDRSETAVLSNEIWDWRKTSSNKHSLTSMRIITYSDLHLEFGSSWMLPPDASGDVMILAGSLNAHPESVVDEKSPL